MLRQVSSQIYQWRGDLPGNHQPVNSYLFPVPGGLALVDPAEDLTPACLASAGLPRAKVILLTHVQEEHVAGVANFSGVPVWIPAGDAYLCKGLAAYLRQHFKWPSPWNWEERGHETGQLAGAATERPPHVAFVPAGEVQEGDCVEGVRVVGTAGHGKNAVSYLYHTPEGEAAFCGDLVCGNHGQLWNWFDCDWDYGTCRGQRALRQSALRLLALHPDRLYPAHGDPIDVPHAALASLAEKLNRIMAATVFAGTEQTPVNMPEVDSLAPGFRVLSPHLHQWRTGNLAVLLSSSGAALFVDDGLCVWESLSERRLKHRAVIRALKETLRIERIDVVIPSHYHGDHTENIPDLVSTEGTRVVSLDSVAEPMEHPEAFNLAALLPWYDTENDIVGVHRKLRDGDRLKWHEYELEIFHLGGQTRYHAGIAVSVDGRNVIFAGDSCFPNQAGCEPVLCWNDASPYTCGYPYAVERLIERCPDLIVSAHGMALFDPMPYLRMKKKRWHAIKNVYESLSARKMLDDFFTPPEAGNRGVRY